MFTLAIIGRPNVGKSTLFNRLAGKRLAIVNDVPGVTRDWREAEAHLFDLNFRVLDTAGLEESFDESIQARMRRQTEAALDHADAILFMVDGRAGMTPMDEHFAGWLRRQKKPVIPAVNKAENERAVQNAIAEAYSLGFGEPVVLSSAHGEGMEELYHALEKHIEAPPPVFSQTEGTEAEGEREYSNLDAIEGDENYTFRQEEDHIEKPIKIAIVGRPNVGKSTLLNAIVKEPRVMTGPEAGITRDAVAVDWIYEGRVFRLVDTAGIRRRAKVQNEIEKMSVEDALRAIRLAQVVILVLDANTALEKQDVQIAEHVIDEGRALVIALNKWDDVRGYEGGKKDLLKDFQWKLEKNLAQIKALKYVPLSALKEKNIGKLLETLLETYTLWNKRVNTGKLNRWLRGMESQNPAPLVAGKQNRLKYIAQIKTRPPTFALWVSRPKELPQAYRRYLINGLRRDFDIPAVPVRLLVRASKNPYT